jgi:hypothetical protein
MKVFVFGNPEIALDSLPVRLLPLLKKECPEWTFVMLDPNEEWEVPSHMLIVDTVVNIEEPRVFEGLEQFMRAPRLTCHDFDAYANLQLLKKLGHIKDATIFGIPPKYDEQKAMEWLIAELKTMEQEYN